VRVLLDENLPHDLIAELTGHDVQTVQGLGWAGVKNGDLLDRAAGQIDAFVTMDRKLEREHDLTVLGFGVIVLLARSNRVQHLLPLVAPILEVLQQIKPGQVEHVGA
jgi:Domain of unknown function (DUF5615)